MCRVQAARRGMQPTSRLPAFINLFPPPSATFVLSPDNMPPPPPSPPRALTRPVPVAETACPRVVSKSTPVAAPPQTTALRGSPTREYARFASARKRRGGGEIDLFHPRRNLRAELSSIARSPFPRLIARDQRRLLAPTAPLHAICHDLPKRYLWVTRC